MMKGLLVESHFLPSLEYFCVILQHNRVVIEKHEHYVKQTYRNRCYVLGANGKERLTVPLTMKRDRASMQSVHIDYRYRWQTNFWRTFQSAYAKSPFFDHYQDELKEELFSNESPRCNVIFDLHTFNRLAGRLPAIELDSKFNEMCRLMIAFDPPPHVVGYVAIRRF